MKTWTPEEIKTFRKKLGLYQREFAEILGVTKEHINRLEKGSKTPSQTLRLLLDCLEKQFKKGINKARKGVTEYGKRNLQKR